MTMSLNASTIGKNGVFPRFLAWWLDGLAAITDGKTGHAAPWTRLMVKTSEDVSIHTRRGNATTLVKRFDGDTIRDRAKRWRLPPSARARHGDVSVLRLAQDQVLQHRLKIPPMAEDVIEPVIANQLERLAPWPSEELIYGYEISRADTDESQLTVDCVATSRKRIADAIDDAERFQFVPDRIDVSGDVDAAHGISLLGVTTGDDKQDTRPLARTLAAIALLAGLAGAAGLGHIALQKSRLADLETQIAGVDAHVAAAHRLEESNTALLQERARLINRRASDPAMVSTLEALSRALPDHAYLDRLEIRGQEVELRGSARDAASLMKGLEASPAFVDAGFSAPTTRKGSHDTFAITLRLTPSPSRRESR